MSAFGRTAAAEINVSERGWTSIGTKIRRFGMSGMGGRPPEMGASPTGEGPELTHDAVRELGQLREWAVGVEGERIERREREESEAVFAKGRETIADFDALPADFAERWLRAEYSIDAELHHAWDNRHDSDDAMRWCKRCIRHALGRLREAAAHVPDAAATSTKAAIAAAMIRGGGKPPPSAPPDYSKMTDGEFREAVKKEHGYTPL